MSRYVATDDILVPEEKAALQLGVKPRTLQYLRKMGQGPTHIQVSVRKILYRQSDIDQWLKTKSVRNLEESEG